MQPVSMPYYFDINGDKHVNYAYGYGPHSGKQCECDECKKFNNEFENRAEQMKLLDKVHKDAYNTFSAYFMQHSFGMNNGQVDLNIAMQVMVNFAKKQIAEYQNEMVKKVQQIQLEHTARIDRVMNQQNKMAVIRQKRNAERLVKQESDGRLFRVGEKEETE